MPYSMYMFDLDIFGNYFVGKGTILSMWIHL